MQNRIQFDVPFSTLLKIMAAALFGYAVLQLAPLIVILLISMIIAVTLVPVVDYLAKHKIPEGLAQAIVGCVFVGFTLFVMIFLLPEVVSQLADIAKELPKYEKQLEETIHVPFIRDQLHHLVARPPESMGATGENVAKLGSATLMGVYNLVLLLTLTIYFMIDGERSYKWILAFFDADQQRKIDQTKKEVRPVISAYISGQLITCAFVAIYVFAVMMILHVPGALTLTVLATIADIIPVVGFIISIFTAVLMALTVSPATALIVVGLYLLYHLIENYLIIPKVYGSKMNLSKLAVLLSILVGGVLAGVAGMFLVLPIVGSYPVIERIWLRKKLGEETIDAHEKLLDDQD